MQRRSLRAAAAALAAPTEAEAGLAVDPDVAAEAAAQRSACAAHLRQNGKTVPPLLPAEAAVVPLDGGSTSPLGKASSAIAAKVAAVEGADGGDAGAGADVASEAQGRPFAVQMWGLRKVYKVRG
jgi:hypothetical protein